jgi:hypothetical protein
MSAKRKQQQPHAQQQQLAARRTRSELEGESRERRGQQIGSSSDALLRQRRHAIY